MAKVKKSKRKQPQQLVPRTFNWPDIDRMFDNFKKDFEQTLALFPAISFPTVPFPLIPKSSCDLVDEGSRYVVKVDLPGVKKKEIKLNMTDNSIEIDAKHKDEAQEKKKNYLKKERSEVSYYRTLPLPEKILVDKSKAKLTDGTLTISLPKAKPTSNQKKKSIDVL
jgi:HSP20 family protein